MPRFFIESPLISGEIVTIFGEDAHHISRALRMRTGEVVSLCGPEGLPHTGILSAFGKADVSVLVGAPLPQTGEPAVSVTLFLGIPKQDKLALTIRQAVELGVSEIVPFLSSRSMVRSSQKEEKLARWQKIAKEAAMQAGRGKIPKILAPVSFETALALASEASLPLFCYEGSGTSPLSAAVAAGMPLSSVSAVIGPEGGFSAAEAKQAAEAGFAMVSLGSRILRCETAPLGVLSAVLFAAGEM